MSIRPAGRRIRPALAAVLLSLGAVLLAASAVDGGEGAIRWRSLSEGQRIARKERKPVVVDFYVPSSCPRCARMEQSVYSVPEVIERMNRDFVPVRIDLSRELDVWEKDLGERYGYREDCLLLFLDPDGRIVADPAGRDLCFADYIPPDRFMEYLDAAGRKASGR